jgi:hypothetical protein
MAERDSIYPGQYWIRHLDIPSRRSICRDISPNYSILGIPGPSIYPIVTSKSSTHSTWYPDWSLGLLDLVTLEILNIAATLTFSAQSIRMIVNFVRNIEAAQQKKKRSNIESEVLQFDRDIQVFRAFTYLFVGLLALMIWSLILVVAIDLPLWLLILRLTIIILPIISMDVFFNAI